MEVKLRHEEVEVLKRILNQVVIKKRTGEIGINHGADRFVSTNLRLRRNEIEALDSLAFKIRLDTEIKKIVK